MRRRGREEPARGPLTPDRLATFASRRAGLAREFLDYYASAAAGQDVLAAWNDWAELTFDPPLREIERDCLLWAVTHVAEGPKRGKVRVMLNKPAGHQFTHLHEDSDHVLDADLERISSGDLKREEDETWLSYVRRLAIGLGYMEETAEPPLKPMPELRLPYKDPPEPRTPDAYVVEVPDVALCGCSHPQHEAACNARGCPCGTEAREEEERVVDLGVVGGLAAGRAIPGVVAQDRPERNGKGDDLDW